MTRTLRAMPGPSGPAGNSRHSPTREVVGRGLISRIVACRHVIIQMKSTPTKPHRPSTAVHRRDGPAAEPRRQSRESSPLGIRTGRRGSPFAGCRFRSARLASRAHQKAGAHRLARYEWLQQGRRHRAAHPPASSSASAKIECIHRTGAVKRLEHGRVPASPRANPCSERSSASAACRSLRSQPCGQPGLVAGQLDRLGRRAEKPGPGLLEVAGQGRQDSPRLRRDQHGKIGRTSELANLVAVLARGDRTDRPGAGLSASGGRRAS